MEKDYCDIIFEKHFGDSKCRAKWEAWNPNLRANIGTSIVCMEQAGPIPAETITEIRNAIMDNNPSLLFNITSRGAGTTVRHTSSYGSTIRSTYPAAVNKEFSIDIDGENYLIIYGNHVNGGFCCIPNRGFSCEMSDADDTSYNAKKLFHKFDLRTSFAIAEAIKKLCGSESKADAKPNSLEENASILEQPWPTVMHLSTRAHNCLARNAHPRIGGKELHTVGDVAALTMDAIYAMRNAGAVTRREIADELLRLGVKYSSWYNV